MEAPNHTTLCITVYDEEIKTYNNYTVLDLNNVVINKLCRAIMNFDPDEEFNELWCPQFAKHNNFTPSQFMQILLNDKDYFDRVILDLYYDRHLDHI